jgi:hypothetical protein
MSRYHWEVTEATMNHKLVRGIMSKQSCHRLTKRKNKKKLRMLNSKRASNLNLMILKMMLHRKL